MADTRRIILIVGIAILGLAVIGGLLGAMGAPEAVWILFVGPLSLVLNPVTLIILLIVFLVRRNDGQQQQQQVVVNVDGAHQAPTNQGPQLRCPKCKTLNPKDSRFCGSCGLSFQPKASST